MGPRWRRCWFVLKRHKLYWYRQPQVRPHTPVEADGSPQGHSSCPHHLLPLWSQVVHRPSCDSLSVNGDTLQRGMSCYVLKSTFPSSSVVLSILVIGHSFLSKHCHSALGWAPMTQGRLGHWGVLATPGWGGGRVNTRSRTVQGTHAVTKEKPREWGAGWGAHRGGQSSLRPGAGSLGSQHLRASQAEGESGQREGPVARGGFPCAY